MENVGKLERKKRSENDRKGRREKIRRGGRGEGAENSKVH